MNFSLTGRDYLIAFVIIAFALVYRTQIIIDRARDDQIAFYPPNGSDQQVYYGSIDGWKNGTFPTSTFFFQPGMSYLLIAISNLMQTDNPGTLRLLLAFGGSLNCGLMMAAVRLLFGKRSISIIAACFLAVYPVSAFLDTDFVITSQATILVTILLFSVLWLWRFPQTWAGAVLAGLSISALALMRRELIALAPILGLWLLWQHGHKRTLVQLTLAGLMAVLVILPIALHNRVGGADYLKTPVSDAEIYRGNNRNAHGDYRVTQADSTTSPDFIKNLWLDVSLSPRRFIEFELHKLGMYLSLDEPGNNLSYVESGKAISPVLQINPLDFRILIILCCLGIVLAWRHHKTATVLLILMGLVMMGTTMLIWVETRIRTPVIVAMIPLAAYSIVYVAEIIVAFAKCRLKIMSIMPVIISLPVIALILIGFQWAYINLPNRVTVSSLPSDAQAANVVYDDALKLVGWKIEEQYSRAGIIEPFNAYVVTFYWQLQKPVTQNYQFSLAYYVNQEPVMAFDHPIGGVSYPETTTSQWQVGPIYVEHVALAWKKFTGPINQSGNLFLVVYPKGLAEHPFKAIGAPESPLALRIAQPAMIWGNGKWDTLTEVPNYQTYTFGDQLSLKNWSLPEKVTVDESFNVILGWQTTSVPIKNSYSIGIYAFNDAGEFVAQTDSPPLTGRLLTTSLPVNYQLEDSHTLIINSIGDFRIYVGVYDNITNERLPLPETSNNLAFMGEVTVQ